MKVNTQFLKNNELNKFETQKCLDGISYMLGFQFFLGDNPQIP